ncbi:UvrD-helicase domain-containing protein [Raineyella fluvialis]
MEVIEATTPKEEPATSTWVPSPGAPTAATSTADAGPSPATGPAAVTGTAPVLGATAGTAPAPAPGPAASVESAIVPTRRPWQVAATRAELVNGLGLDEALAERVLACADEDAILDLAGAFVDWRSNALLELAAGATVAEVKDRLEITEAPGRDDSDQAILDGLRQPASQGAFTFVENNDELRRIIEEGDFGAWRVWLHPEQRKYVTRDYQGPFRLSGGAGTGKTVVLLHRARRLAKANPQARIVLTTFTTNLADALARDLSRLDPDLPRAQELGDPGVLVRGVDALAYAAIKSAGSEISAAVDDVLGAPSSHVQQRTAGDAWKAAIATAGSDLPAALHTPHFLQAEYEAVVLPGHITAQADYLRVRRPGRGVRLNRKERAAVWQVIEAYRASSRVEGTLDFAEAATVAAAHLTKQAAEGQGHRADHLLVDEGQDLSPAHWQLLRALVGEGPNDLFIAEDSHQRIYGHKLVLGQYGIRIVGRSQRLTLNYRTTAENLHFALGVLDGGTYADLEDQPEETGRYHSSRRGPVPQVIACGSMNGELDTAANLIRGWAEQAPQEGRGTETIAILVRDQYQRDRVVSGLGERGVNVRPVDREAVKPGPPVAMTMHRAKGTEFSKVLLFGMSEKSIPKIVRGADYSVDEKQDALLRERSLLYVAASRARDELVVTWSGEASELLPRG